MILDSDVEKELDADFTDDLTMTCQVSDISSYDIVGTVYYFCVTQIDVLLYLSIQGLVLTHAPLIASLLVCGAKILFKKIFWTQLLR